MRGCPVVSAAEKTMKSLSSKLTTLITREYTLNVSAERLTRIIAHGLRHNALLTEAVENLTVAITAPHLTITGRFQHDRWSGRFYVRLQPDRVIWNPQRHTILFKLLDHDIQFDRSLRGVLASIGLATIEGVFGKNFILNKTVTAIQGDQVEITLDHLNPERQPIWDAFTLHRIKCVENTLQLVLSTHPRKLLKGIGRLLANRLPGNLF